MMTIFFLTLEYIAGSRSWKTENWPEGVGVGLGGVGSVIIQDQEFYIDTKVQWHWKVICDTKQFWFEAFLCT